MKERLKEIDRELEELVKKENLVMEKMKSLSRQCIFSEDYKKIRIEELLPLQTLYKHKMIEKNELRMKMREEKK